MDPKGWTTFWPMVSIPTSPTFIACTTMVWRISAIPQLTLSRQCFFQQCLIFSNSRRNLIFSKFVMSLLKINNYTMIANWTNCMINNKLKNKIKKDLGKHNLHYYVCTFFILIKFSNFHPTNNRSGFLLPWMFWQKKKVWLLIILLPLAFKHSMHLTKFTKSSPSITNFVNIN